MRQPLLLEENKQEEVNKDSFVQRSPQSNRRVTPKHLTMSQGNKSKTPTNPMKHQQFDKFNSGMKGQLMADN